MHTRDLKINSDNIAGHREGDTVNIFVDSEETPINPFWRRRLKEAQMDNCCEFIEQESKKHKKEVKRHDNQRS